MLSPPCGTRWAPGLCALHVPLSPGCLHKGTAPGVMGGHTAWVRRRAARDLGPKRGVRKAAWEGRRWQVCEKPRGESLGRSRWGLYARLAVGPCGHQGAAAAHSSGRRRRDLWGGAGSRSARSRTPPRAEAPPPPSRGLPVSSLGSPDRSGPRDVAPAFTAPLLLVLLSGSPVEFGVSAGEEGVSGGLRVGEWV